MPGKTGTTEAINNDNGSRDQWMIGYTPDVVVATWMGYDQSGNYSLSASSREGVGPLFKLEMEGLLQFTANTPFNVEAVKTKQNNQNNNSNNGVDQFIKDAQKRANKFGIKSKNGVKTSGINSEIDNANVRTY